MLDFFLGLEAPLHSCLDFKRVFLEHGQLLHKLILFLDELLIAD